jgi:hypothetical protein
MGWVKGVVFSPEPKHDAGHVHPTCVAKQVIILLEGDIEECVWPCASDNDCTTGHVCDGDGVKSVNWTPGDAVQFCRIGNRGTTPVTIDAGPPPSTQDAGAPKDAGGGGTGLVCVKQDAQFNCKAPFVKTGAVCRLKCTAPTDCKGPNPKCNGGFCFNDNGCGPSQ